MPTQDMDGLRMLAADHRKVEGLFGRYQQARGVDAKRRLVQEICTELKIHATIEEEIFYPEIRSKVDDDALDEAWVEHDAAKLLVNELEAAAPDEAFYDAKMKVLSELIEHHVKEEEKQNENLFQQTRAAAGVDREALGQQMMARKQQLQAQAEAGALPRAEAATLQHEDV
ncbi:MAG: hemerythrin domain-containing protein [Sphingosinicella sp.]